MVDNRINCSDCIVNIMNCVMCSDGRLRADIGQVMWESMTIYRREKQGCNNQLRIARTKGYQPFHLP